MSVDMDRIDHVVDPPAGPEPVDLVFVEPVQGPAREPAAGPVVDLARWAPTPHVTAVLVAHEGAQFLPRALAALSAQTRRPDLTIAVDTGSRDGSGVLLQSAAVRVHVLEAGRVGFAEAVAAALAAFPAADAPAVPRQGAAGGGGTGGIGERSWVWLLHDDSAPAPDALEWLLAAVETSPSVAVAGCKQVSWDDGQRLLDVGFTTSRLGAVVTGIDRGEVDQGQHDLRSDVLAVGTAGMLVRRDVWETLGGPDPALAGARTDLDLCRRARLAGHRVVVVPSAMVAHAAASATRRRPRSSWYRDDRRDALFLRLAGVSAPMVVPALVWSSIASVLRFVFRLVLKQPRQAFDELAAVLSVLLRPDRWLRTRHRVRVARTVPARALRPLRPTLRQLLRLRRDEVAAWIVPADRRATTGAHAAPVGPPTGGLTLPLARNGRSATKGANGKQAKGKQANGRTATPGAAVGPALGSPAGSFTVETYASPHAVRLLNLVGRLGSALPVVLLAGAAAAWAGRRVLTGTGAVVGPFLPPAPDTADALRQAAAASWRAVGLGAEGVGDPLMRVLAEGSVLVGGDPGRLVAVLLVAGPLLAGITAWVAAPAVTSSWVVRTWAALGWAASPPLLAAALTGRPGAVLVHVLLPLLALAALRSVGAGSVAAAAAAGLLLTVVLAAAPSLTLAAIAVLLVLAIAATLLAGPARSLLMLLTAIVPAVALLPWWVAVAQRPGLLFADPALGWDAAPGPATWRLLLLPGSPSDLFGAVARAAQPAVRSAASGPLDALGAGTPGATGIALAVAALVVAPAALLALASLLRRSLSGTAARVCWAVTLLGLAVALAGERSVLGVRSWPGPGLSLAALGVLGAALVVVPALANRLRGRSFGLRHVATAALTVLCGVGPLVALAGFAFQGGSAASAGVGSGAGVRRADVDVLPAVAVAEAQGPAAIRTLVLAVDAAQVRWSLVDGDGARLGDDSAAAHVGTSTDGAVRSSRDAALVTPVVAALLSDSVQDVRVRLADLAVGSVVLLPPVDEDAQQALDNAPGLVRVATSARSLMWRVEPATVGAAGTRPSRVRILAVPTAPTVPTTPTTPTTTAGAGVGSPTVLAALPATRSTVGLSVDTTVAAGPAGRIVVLAEHEDGGWHAALDGVALARTSYAGWAQAFVLPAHGGRLEVRHSAGTASQLAVDLGWARIAVLVLALLIAAPLPRVTRRVAAPAPARRSRPVVRDPSVIFGPPLQPIPQVFTEEHPEDGDVAPMLAELPPTRWQRVRRTLRHPRVPGTPAVVATDSAVVEEVPAQDLPVVDEAPDEARDEAPDEERGAVVDPPAEGAPAEDPPGAETPADDKLAEDEPDEDEPDEDEPDEDLPTAAMPVVDGLPAGETS